MIDLIKQWQEEGIEQGFEKGIQQGIERGIEQGQYQKAIETAQNLIKMGLSDEQIAEATGLSIDEVGKLR